MRLTIFLFYIDTFFEMKTSLKIQFNYFMKNSKIDFLMMAVLSIVIIVTRIFFMENYLETLVFIDSFKHISSAIFSNPSEAFQGSFVVFISLIYPSNLEPNDAITFMRLIMIVFSIQLVLCFYLIIKNFFSSLFAFTGGLFVCFLPIFLVYSTTLHNDIFSLAMAFTSLYIIIRFKNLLGFTLAPIFILLAATTRIESVIFIIPFLISFSRYLHKKIGISIHIVLTALFAVCFGIGLLIVQVYEKGFYYHNQFESPIHQIIFFLTPKNSIMIFNSIFTITENESINHLFLFIVSLGVFSVLILHRKKISKIFNKNNGISDKTIVAIYLSIIFGLSFIFLASFHIGWVYDDEGNLIAKEEILPRYLLTSRVLVSIPFVYIIMIFSNQANKSMNSIFNTIRGMR